jgi:hypothetical protein
VLHVERVLPFLFRGQQGSAPSYYPRTFRSPTSTGFASTTGVLAGVAAW